MGRETDEEIVVDNPDLLDDLPEVDEEKLVEAPNFSADPPEEEEQEDEKPEKIAADDPELLFAEDDEKPQPKKSQEDEDLELRDRVYREKRARFEEVAKVEAEKEEAETRAKKADLRATEAELKSLDRELAATRADLEAAQEKGESKKVADAMDALADLRAKKLMFEKDKKELASEVEAREKNPVNPNARAWTRLNPWYNDTDRYSGSRYEKMRSATREADAQLYKEGRFDPRTPEYFRELDSRVRAKVPEAFGKKPAKQPSANQPERRESVVRSPAPVRSSPSGGGGGNSGRTVLGPAQQKAMREMHLDPGNKAHVAAWTKAVRDEQKRTSK